MTLTLPGTLEGERARLEPAEVTGIYTIVRRSDDATAGTLHLRAEGAMLIIDKLKVDDAYRGYGLGSEAARLVIDAAEADPMCTAIRASAPPDIGLAVYFWSRMGLRPLHGPGPNEGIWFERQL